MKTKTNFLISFLLLFCFQQKGSCQDTIIHIIPSNGYFFVEYFDEEKNVWINQEFMDSVLFSIEELDSASKYYPAGPFRGFYKDGKPAFIRSFIFNGRRGVVHGEKKIYYPNGNLKESGQFHQGIKIGQWRYFASDGNLTKSIAYNVPKHARITGSDYTFELPITKDTIHLKEYNDFMEIVEVIDYGKNGLEIHYKNSAPVLVIRYVGGKEISRETKRRRMKKMIRRNA